MTRWTTGTERRMRPRSLDKPRLLAGRAAIWRWLACASVVWMVWLGMAHALAAPTAEQTMRLPVKIEMLGPANRAHLNADQSGVRLPSDGSEARFLVRFDLPARSLGESRWLLRFNRVELKRLQLRAPGWQPAAQSFFDPRAEEGLLPMAFQQILPGEWTGPVSVEVTASADLVRTLRPQVVRAALAQEQDKRALAIAVALYAGVLVLGVVAVSLLVGARELAFVSFLAFMVATLMLMLTANGHAYTLRALAWMRPLGAQGLNVSMLMVCAFGVMVARDYAGKLPSNPWLRWLPVAGASAMLALAVATLLGLRLDVGTMQTLVTVGWVAAGLLSLLAFVNAMLRRAWLGWLLLCALVLLGASCTLFELSVRGIGHAFWGQYGYQIGLVLVALVMVLALVGRIADFRLKHERERMARRASEQRLQQQQTYAALAVQLQQRLADVAPNDLEWVAIQMAMERLLPLLRLSSATLLLYRAGYDQVRITEPVTHTSRVGALIDANAETLHAVVKRQVAMNDLELVFPQAAGVPRRNGVPVYAAVPLSTSTGTGTGVALLERAGAQPFDEEELALATRFGLLVLERTAEARANHKLRRSAELDALTGLLNRNAIDSALRAAFAASHQKREQLAVLFADVDHFKAINDTHGHACGDLCLQQIAATLRHALRPGDLLGRYGGEEFVIVLTGPAADRAREVGERMRVLVERAEVPWQGETLNLTISVGVATRLPHESTPTAALERADRALYAAKHEGRNRVNLAAQPEN